MKIVYDEFDKATGGRFKAAAMSASKRTYYQTKVNTRDFKEILNPVYRRYYKELTLLSRFFIQFQYRTPGIYHLLRKKFTGCSD